MLVRQPIGHLLTGDSAAVQGRFHRFAQPRVLVVAGGQGSIGRKPTETLPGRRAEERTIDDFAPLVGHQHPSVVTRQFREICLYPRGNDLVPQNLLSAHAPNVPVPLAPIVHGRAAGTLIHHVLPDHLVTQAEGQRRGEEEEGEKIETP